MGRSVAIDADACIGCEACVDEAPDVFAMGPGDIAHVINPDGGNEKDIESAMDLCPANCIYWED